MVTWFCGKSSEDRKRTLAVQEEVTGHLHGSSLGRVAGMGV